MERSSTLPDFSGLDLVLAQPTSRSGAARTEKFSAWLTERMRERAQIWKNTRMYRNEQRGGFVEGDSDDEEGGGARRGKKKGAAKGSGKVKPGGGGASDAPPPPAAK